MAKTKTPIISAKPTFIGTKNKLVYRAICIFVATVFFLTDDTFYGLLRARALKI